MNFSEIETFLMIVQTKNITKTSENLFLSQPTVSHRLKALEDELNTKLIVRKKGHKTIELTPKGEEFISIAQRWMTLWREMQMIQSGQEKILLTVGCIVTLNTTVMYPFYSQVLKEKNQINLRLRTHQSSELYGLLEKHEIDIGFVYHHLHYKNVVATPVLREKMYLVQREEYALRKERIHTDEMDPRKELFFSWDTNYQIWHDQFINQSPHSRLQVDTFMLISNILGEDGSLWLIAPASTVRELAKYHKLYVSEIANETPPPERLTYEIKHKYTGATLQEGIGIFDDMLQKYLKERYRDIWVLRGMGVSEKWKNDEKKGQV